MTPEKLHSYPDLLYGEIQFTEAEERILRTPQMSRLKRISLSAVPDWALPTLTPPTRYEHSRAVAHLARLTGEKLSLKEEIKRDLFFAGLVHDVATPPFSHVSEPFQEKITRKNHEQAVESYLLGTELGEKIVSQGGDLARIIGLVNGEGEPYGSLINGRSSIDLDNLDNSLRYLRGLGLGQGRFFYSPEKQAKAYEIYGGKLVLRISPEDLEGWLDCRRETYKFVYSSDNLSPGAMLSRALYFAEKEEELDNDFFLKDEAEARVYLKNDCNPRTGELIKNMENWANHYRQIVSLEATGLDPRWRHLFTGIEPRFRVADEMSSILGVKPENVCVYFGWDRGYKKIQIPLLDDKGRFWSADSLLSEKGDLKQRWMVQVYVHPDLKEKKNAIQAAFNESVGNICLPIEVKSQVAA